MKKKNFQTEKGKGEKIFSVWKKNKPNKKEEKNENFLKKRKRKRWFKREEEI
jgi:hypothetical protein